MTDSYNQTNINLGAAGPGAGFALPDFSVNEAAVDGGYADGSIVLRTSARPNGAGAFNGGGTGNKAIYSAFGYDGLPISSLSTIEFVWSNVIGPAGPNFIPPEAVTTVTPYINLIVDFDPLGAGDKRVLVVISDQLNLAISASLGTYVNNGLNVLTYSWTSAMNALIVLAPPNPVPGGVLPDVTVGASWPENSYKWSDLVIANPTAIFSDCSPPDGGLPAGACVPAINLVSGDSGTVIKSGKRIHSFTVNGQSII